MYIPRYVIHNVMLDVLHLHTTYVHTYVCSAAVSLLIEWRNVYRMRRKLWTRQESIRNVMIQKRLIISETVTNLYNQLFEQRVIRRTTANVLFLFRYTFFCKNKHPHLHCHFLLKQFTNFSRFVMLQKIRHISFEPSTFFSFVFVFFDTLSFLPPI
jgi:hypothetical protein